MSNKRLLDVLGYWRREVMFEFAKAFGEVHNIRYLIYLPHGFLFRLEMETRSELGTRFPEQITRIYGMECFSSQDERMRIEVYLGDRLRWESEMIMLESCGPERMRHELIAHSGRIADAIEVSRPDRLVGLFRPGGLLTG